MTRRNFMYQLITFQHTNKKCSSITYSNGVPFQFTLRARLDRRQAKGPRTFEQKRPFGSGLQVRSTADVSLPPEWHHPIAVRLCTFSKQDLLSWPGQHVEHIWMDCILLFHVAFYVSLKWGDFPRHAIECFGKKDADDDRVSCILSYSNVLLPSTFTLSYVVYFLLFHENIDKNWM